MVTTLSCNVCNSINNVKRETFVLLRVKDEIGHRSDYFRIDVCDSCYRIIMKKFLRKQIDRTNIRLSKCFEEAIKSNGVSFQI